MTGSTRARLSEGASWQRAFAILPKTLEQKILELPSDVLFSLEELRLRADLPIELCGQTDSVYLHKQIGTTRQGDEAYRLTSADLSHVMQNMTQFSLYAVEEELRRGFITIPGGHRVGVAGRVVLQSDGSVKSIRNISSLNVRIARSIPGAADRLRPYLYRRVDKAPLSVLLLSPPNCGKTTLLRDLARQWSDNLMVNRSRKTHVTVIDERSEIAGCIDGIPQFSVGQRTDVLDGCPKAEGMMMAIRSLSPDVLVTDEIGREEDVQAILEAAHAGVAVLASAHAADLADWRQRPHMEDLFASKAFMRYVLLSRRKGPGTVEAVLDERGRAIS